MTQIVSDPAQPQLIIVRMRAGGHALCVGIERQALHSALGLHDTFAALAPAVGENIEWIGEAASRKSQATGDDRVFLGHCDLFSAMPAGAGPGPARAMMA